MYVSSLVYMRDMPGLRGRGKRFGFELLFGADADIVKWAGVEDLAPKTKATLTSTRALLDREGLRDSSPNLEGFALQQFLGIRDMCITCMLGL